MEKFEGWFRGENLSLSIDLSLLGLGCTKKEQGLYTKAYNNIVRIVSLTWNHQQAKIDKLEKENKELRWDGALNEAEEKIAKLTAYSKEAIEEARKINKNYEIEIYERKKLEAERKELIEALDFYANDRHIREYSNGQTVMLEASECDTEVGNRAEQALSKIKSEVSDG